MQQTVIIPKVSTGIEGLDEVTDGGFPKGRPIRVADNGIGFDPAYAERIFEVFQRLHTASEYPGTGIGLAICRKIMQAHSGHITADGKPGEGSVFNIYLPLNR